MGFEELQHTADWSLRVWADDLPGLFAESARAMNTLAGVMAGPGPRVKRVFESEGPDAETLLVAFLSELLFYQEQENLTFDQFDFGILDRRISLNMQGASIASIDKAIKAVTWHNLKIEKTSRGLETEIVLDV
jgi:SHS2 domain-containing protein